MKHAFPTRRSSDLAHPAQELFMAPGRPSLDRGRQEEFHIGLRAHHRADVAAVEHGALETARRGGREAALEVQQGGRSEEHTSELQSLMRISYAVFCLKKKQPIKQHRPRYIT